MSPKERAAKVEGQLKLVGPVRLGRKNTFTSSSGGMQQRVGLARGLCIRMPRSC